MAPRTVPGGRNTYSPSQRLAARFLDRYAARCEEPRPMTADQADTIIRQQRELLKLLKAAA